MGINGDDPSDEPTQAEVDAHELMQIMNEYSEAFFKLCQERHLEGAARYGELTFVENDVIRMMAEELADTANYCRMQFVKLMMLNNVLVDKVAELGLAEDGEVQLGMKAFKGTKDIGWGKS